MAFAFFVCALVLLTVLYFAALVTGEIAFWFVNRLAQIDRNPLTALTSHR